jgi:hypothetical protein
VVGSVSLSQKYDTMSHRSLSASGSPSHHIILLSLSPYTQHAVVKAADGTTYRLQAAVLPADIWKNWGRKVGQMCCSLWGCGVNWGT